MWVMMRCLVALSSDVRSAMLCLDLQLQFPVKAEIFAELDAVSMKSMTFARHDIHGVPHRVESPKASPFRVLVVLLTTHRCCSLRWPQILEFDTSSDSVESCSSLKAGNAANFSNNRKA